MSFDLFNYEDENVGAAIMFVLNDEEYLQYLKQNSENTLGPPANSIVPRNKSMDLRNSAMSRPTSAYKTNGRVTTATSGGMNSEDQRIYEDFIKMLAKQNLGESYFARA
eukprot:TRINITY_DN2745_c0_g2_i1.p2 TRINITY_DN2745_c0_g2~~TRINITY_DN2745_c0_g2_i1.p2  ORF type:complete len:109 (-),score=14.00 TRINITY_DN2745_c0_g2_i1:45-371(-)